MTLEYTIGYTDGINRAIRLLTEHPDDLGYAVMVLNGDLAESCGKLIRAEQEASYL